MLAQERAEQLDLGRVTVVYWPGFQPLALALSEVADRPQRFPGIVDTLGLPIRIILARNAAHVDSILHGRAPQWSEGVALPEARTIVLNADRRGRSPRALERVLRHELAHLALRANAYRAVPRWFDEGYASFSGGEWRWRSAVRVSWEVMRGRIPTLGTVVRRLRESDRDEAASAYLLAASAVALLYRWGGERGLDPLMDALRTGGDFDASLQQVYGMNTGQFEVFWRRDLRERYSWLAVLTGVGIFWGPIGVLLIWIGVVRRRRNRYRRLRLDEGSETSQLLDASEVRG